MARVRLSGDETDNQLIGSSANDYITGSGGDDLLRGLAGRDILFGGTGDDTVRGGAHNDELVGETIFPDFGNDLLNGGTGDDTILAGLGGADKLIGGAGADTFRFRWSSDELTPQNNKMIIKDFNPDEDTLDFIYFANSNQIYNAPAMLGGSVVDTLEEWEAAATYNRKGHLVLTFDQVKIVLKDTVLEDLNSDNTLFYEDFFL